MLDLAVNRPDEPLCFQRFIPYDEYRNSAVSAIFNTLLGERVLVVDDVLTSGASVRDTLTAVQAAGGQAVGVAVVDECSGGTVRFGGLPFFAAAEFALQTYDPGDCPLCREGVPLTIT